MTTCLNCNNSFTGDFCNLCGQKAATHRFSMHEWLHEIPHSIFHVDSGFFLTIKTLLVRPGDAVREYLEGKRKLLFSPFIYVLVWCGIFVVVSHFLGDSMDKHQNFQNLMEAAAYIEEHYYKIIVVAMILPMAIGSYLAYIRSGFNFAENLVLSCYIMGQLVIADIILEVISFTSFDESYSTEFKWFEFLLKYPYWFLGLLEVFPTIKMVLGNLAATSFDIHLGHRTFGNYLRSSICSFENERTLKRLKLNGFPVFHKRWVIIADIGVIRRNIKAKNYCYALIGWGIDAIN